MVEMTDGQTRSLRVFLCHCRADKAHVRDLYGRLKHDGFEPWLDVENLLPGQDWENEIRRAIRAADIVVVGLSKKSTTAAGFVHKEISYALDVADEQPEGALFIIPLLFEECQVPERLRRWHWANWFEESAYERLVLSLMERAVFLGIAAPPAILVDEIEKPNARIASLFTTLIERYRMFQTNVAGRRSVDDQFRRGDGRLPLDELQRLLEEHKDQETSMAVAMALGTADPSDDLVLLTALLAQLLRSPFERTRFRAAGAIGRRSGTLPDRERNVLVESLRRALAKERSEPVQNALESALTILQI